jgi:hypothetical protein
VLASKKGMEYKDAIEYIIKYASRDNILKVLENIVDKLLK